MKKLKSQLGVTLIEVSVALAIMGFIVGPSLLILKDFFEIPTRASISVTLLQNTRLGTRAIASDARNATIFGAGTPPDYGTFIWTDRTVMPAANHVVRYFYIPEDKTLSREEIIDGGPPETLVVTRNIKNQGDVSIQLVGGEVAISVAATIGASLEEPLVRTTLMTAQLRPSLQVAQPAPPPYRLAWDDFESAGFTGGSGWVDPWFVLGSTAVVLTGGPAEGTFHMSLGQTQAEAERPIDLSGQANVRLQFQAKAIGFQPGDTVLLRVSTDDGNTFTTIRTWIDGEDDDTYRLEDLDLSSFAMTDQFVIAFVSNISTGAGFFFVDDLKVVRVWSG